MPRSRKLDDGNLEKVILDENIFKPNDNETAKKPKQLEIIITRRIKKYQNRPAFIKLGQRLEAARERYVNRITNSVQYLKDLLDIAKDVVVEEQKTKYQRILETTGKH